MGGGEIVKDVIRIASTAGLNKDVIDLLKEKISLLAEQNTTLEKSNAALQKKNTELEQQLANLQPSSGRLHADTERFLQLLFRHKEMSVTQAAAFLGMTHGMTDYHKGVLFDARMAVWTGVGIKTGFGSSEPQFCITQKGREYAVRHGLAA